MALPTSHPSTRRARISRRRGCETFTRRRSRSRATQESRYRRRCSTEERLPLRADALAAVHRPRALAEAEVGRTRLAFDELLVLRLALARTAAERERASAVPLGAPGELIARYRASLPFTLTPDQERSIAEIDADLERSTPMQRLLHGDVGSGKTVVALYALLRAVELGRQGALMAPTETLAEQHFLTMDELCAPLGVRVEPAHELASRPRARRRSPAHRFRGCAHRRGNACPHPERGRLPRPRGGGRGRAAPLRSRPANGTRRGPQPARAPPDRHADPADARPHRLRRSRGERARAAAREPQAGRSRRGSRRNGARRPTSASDVISTTGGRRMSSAR